MSVQSLERRYGWESRCACPSWCGRSVKARYHPACPWTWETTITLTQHGPVQLVSELLPLVLLQQLARPPGRFLLRIPVRHHAKDGLQFLPYGGARVGGVGRMEGLAEGEDRVERERQGAVVVAANRGARTTAVCALSRHSRVASSTFRRSGRFDPGRIAVRARPLDRSLDKDAAPHPKPDVGVRFSPRYRSRRRAFVEERGKVLLDEVERALRTSCGSGEDRAADLGTEGAALRRCSWGLYVGPRSRATRILETGSNAVRVPVEVLRPLDPLLLELVEKGLRRINVAVMGQVARHERLNRLVQAFTV